MSLLDLPNELIIDILSDITLTDIFVVSCLSKRLNILALPIYLAAHGIPEPEQETSLYVLDWDLYNPPLLRPDTLSGLNVSTNISQVKHFKCFFQDPTIKERRNSFQQAYKLSLAIERTARFIDKLKYVGAAEIYLVWDPYYVKGTRKVPIPEFNKWTQSFCRLLNLIVERGCSSLTVQYDSSIVPAFRIRSSNPISKTFSSVFHYVQKHRDKNPHTLHWELQGPVHEKFDLSSIAGTPLSRLAQESKSITTLSLHSNALLLPPFVDWTFSSLYSHSSLTCLTFSHLTFSEDILTALLPLIAEAVSDRLTHLSFLSISNLTAENIVRFITRLPHLAHLSVSRIFCSKFQVSGDKLQALTLPHLPKLQFLQAPTELVSLLLNAQPLSSPSLKNATPTGFSQLRSLTVYPCGQLSNLACYSDSTFIINTLTSQIQNQSRTHEVEYALDLQTEFTNFEIFTRYIQSQTSEQKFYHSIWDDTTGLEVEQLAYRQYGSRIIFRDITRVVFYRLTSQQSPASLCLWLKLLFPQLKTLVFTCRITAQPDLVSFLDPKVVEQLIEELPTACPTVHTLVVADEMYKIGQN